MRGSFRHLPLLNCSGKFRVQGLSPAPAPKPTEQKSQYSSPSFVTELDAGWQLTFIEKNYYCTTKHSTFHMSLMERTFPFSWRSKRIPLSGLELSPEPCAAGRAQQEAQQRFLQSFRKIVNKNYTTSLKKKTFSGL